MNWDFIAVIIAIISLVITLILEWPRLISRFNINESVRKLFTRLITGCIIGLCIGILVGWLSYSISSFMGPYFDLPYSRPLSNLLQRSASIWAVGVGILNILAETRENIYSSNLKMVRNGMIFGFIFGLSIGLILLTLYYVVSDYDFIEKVANTLIDALPTSIGCALLGGIFGGVTNKLAKTLFISS